MVSSKDKKHKQRTTGCMDGRPAVWNLLNVRNWDEITCTTIHHSFRPPLFDLGSMRLLGEVISSTFLNFSKHYPCISHKTVTRPFVITCWQVQRDAHDFMRFLFYFWFFAEIADIYFVWFYEILETMDPLILPAGFLRLD